MLNDQYNKNVYLDQAIEDLFLFCENKITDKMETVKKIKEKAEKQETIQENGFLLKKKLVISKTTRVCPVINCKRYSFSIKDDVYMNKFGCCHECYIQHVEGREELWGERKKVITNDTSKT